MLALRLGAYSWEWRDENQVKHHNIIWMYEEVTQASQDKCQTAVALAQNFYILHWGFRRLRIRIGNKPNLSAAHFAVNIHY